jgi:hypothetical protein
MDDEKRKQVALQCKAVAHLAKAVADVYDHRAMRLEINAVVGDVDLIGKWSANAMEVLGEMLNGMDAVDESDDWMKPVFREAQRLWPQQIPGA